MNPFAELSPPYKTIVADPPWAYDEGFPQGTMPGGGRGTIQLPYSAMSLEEIRRLPVCGIAAPDSWLFLWTTNKYLFDAFSVVRHWGFRYTQTLTWRKTGAPHPFVRSIAPQHSEFVLVAKRGKPTRADAFPSSVIDAPAARRHSAKPPVFGDFIERCCEGPYVELFSREPRFGWDSWGHGYESQLVEAQ